jgi:hypothetical protein
VLTRVNYADTPSVRVWRFDGSHEDWSFEAYRRNASVRSTEAETREFFRTIREFELYFPAELCRYGVTLIDSPGIADSPQRTAITRQAISSCDAAIVVYNSSALAAEDERSFIRETLTGCGVRVFSIINMFEGDVADERFKAYARRHLAEAFGGETGAHQDIIGRDVHLIDALEAHAGAHAGDSRRTELSGLTAFEHSLGEFLANERQRIHVDRFLKESDRLGGIIELQIRQRQDALRIDADRLERQIESVESQTADMAKRYESLSEIFARHRGGCIDEVRKDFPIMVKGLPAVIEQKLMSTKLPSEGGALSEALAQKKLWHEAHALCEQETNQQALDWLTNQSALQPSIQALLGEVHEQVKRIAPEGAPASPRDELDWRAAAAKLEGGGAGLISDNERLWSTIIGIVVLRDFSMATGASTGFRGLKFNLAAQVVTGVVLGLAGAPLMAVAAGGVIIGMIAGVWGGGIGLAGRIKEKVLEDIKKPGEDGSPSKLDRGCARLLEQFELQIREHFDRTSEKVRAEVLGAVQRRTRQLAAEEAKCRRDLTDNAAIQSSLKQSLLRLAALRQKLTALDIALQQSA